MATGTKGLSSRGAAATPAHSRRMHCSQQGTWARLSPLSYAILGLVRPGSARHLVGLISGTRDSWSHTRSLINSTSHDPEHFTPEHGCRRWLQVVCFVIQPICDDSSDYAAACGMCCCDRGTTSRCLLWPALKLPDGKGLCTNRRAWRHRSKSSNAIPCFEYCSTWRSGPAGWLLG